MREGGWVVAKPDGTDVFEKQLEDFVGIVSQGLGEDANEPTKL